MVIARPQALDLLNSFKGMANQPSYAIYCENGEYLAKTRIVPTSLYSRGNGAAVVSTMREKLVATTKDLLWRIGYEAMSPRKILEESGAGQGSLYHHFKGKLDLAVHALGEIDVEMRREFDAVFAPTVPPVERLRNYLTLNRNGLRGCRMGRLANESAINNDELRAPIADFFSYIETRIESTVVEAIEAGDLRQDVDPRGLTAIILSAVQGGFVLSRIHNDRSRVLGSTAAVDTLIVSLTTK